MSYIDEEIKMDMGDEEEEEDIEESLDDSLLEDIPEEDDLLDDEFIGLGDDTEY